jgi:AAA15 family ATPase/GTPase
MASSQQQLLSIHFENLKNLRNVTIDFSGYGLTAIMGTNGSGKSTVLHALACCYKPVDVSPERENYKLFEFFTPNTDALWSGSKFTITHSFRQGRETHDGVTVEYYKSDRWNPKYERRPERNTIFIGVKTCVPRIEDEKKKTFIRYVTSQYTDETSQLIRNKAGYVMNRVYTSLSNNRSTSYQYIGVEHNNRRYTSLSMGAGEQRLFLILSKVFNAPKYSLIIIDEIDLLLHVDALRKLINVLHERAIDKSLQIVFTTHAPSVMEMSESVRIRHLWDAPNQTFCFSETRPDTISRLTGTNVRPLEIFVEDDLSQTIVNHTSMAISMQRYVTTKRFGAAQNCFTLASGLALSGDTLENCLFLLDGDVYKTTEERKEQINQTITGTEPRVEPLRTSVESAISQYNLPEGFKPEKYIHQLIIQLPDNIVESTNEIKRTACGIHNVDNSHKYVTDIIDRIGFESKSVGLHNVIEIASKSPHWNDFIAPLKQWLISKEALVREVVSPQVV